MVPIDNRNPYRILICLIEIWTLNDGDDPLADPVNPRMMTEVENIEIENSYKKLICGASVSFPRGTILHKTLTPDNNYIYDVNTTASFGPDGVLMETKNQNVKTYDENGNEVEIEGARLADVDDFKVGDRIRIWLGYTLDLDILSYAQHTGGPSIYSDKNLLEKYKQELELKFDGYITRVSLETPIELECENLASPLKKKTCPKRTGTKNDGVNTFLDSEKGCLDLLKGTGLKLLPETKECKIQLGKIDLTDNLVVADLLDIWASRKVYSFIRYFNGRPYVAVGRPYFTNSEKFGSDSIMKYDEKADSAVPIIEFDWNVATNGLSLMSTDHKLVAVEAQCLEQAEGSDKFYKITVLPNPQYDPADPKSKKYRTLNETKLSKKALKSGKKVQTDNKDKVNLDKYQIIPYMSRKVDCPHETLVDEAIQYLESYNPNGIEGSLTLFGDLNIQAGMKVQLNDTIHSGKNGYYLVDEVNLTFGTGGYREKITLPYCIQRFNGKNQQLQDS